jgi:hypothetical protein
LIKTISLYEIELLNHGYTFIKPTKCTIIPPPFNKRDRIRGRITIQTVKNMYQTMKLFRTYGYESGKSYLVSDIYIYRRDLKTGVSIRYLKPIELNFESLYPQYQLK